MATQRTIYQQDEYAGTETHRAVADLSDRLLDHLNTEDALRLMLAANLPGLSSAQVQATFLPFATDLGFTSEAKGLFREYENKLRPDYFRPVEDTGILLEVERGKTTTNNMDLLRLLEVSPVQARRLLVPDGSSGAQAQRLDEAQA